MFKAIEPPTLMPKFPGFEELRATSNPQASFDEWATQCDEIEKLNDVLFEKSLKRIFVCGFIRSFLGHPKDTHYSWCPDEKWRAYWKTQNWPTIPTID